MPNVTVSVDFQLDIASIAAPLPAAVTRLTNSLAVNDIARTLIRTGAAVRNSDTLSSTRQQPFRYGGRYSNRVSGSSASFRPLMVITFFVPMQPRRADATSAIAAQ